jgi:hypothetical protein
MGSRAFNRRAVLLLLLLSLPAILVCGGDVWAMVRPVGLSPLPTSSGINAGNASCDSACVATLLEDAREDESHRSLVTTLGAPTLLARSPEFDPTARQVHAPPPSSADSLNAPNSRVTVTSGSQSWIIGVDTSMTLAESKRALALAALTALESITQETDWRHSEWISNYAAEVTKLVKLDTTIGHAECDDEDAFYSDHCQDWAALLYRINPMAIEFGINPFSGTYSLSHVSAAASSDPDIATTLGPLSGDGTPLEEFGVGRNS